MRWRRMAHKADNSEFPLLVVFDDSLHNRWSATPEGVQPEYDAAVDLKKKSSAPSPMDSVTGGDKLNSVVMCQACQAHGYIKKQYGYRVMTEQCVPARTETAC